MSKNTRLINQIIEAMRLNNNETLKQDVNLNVEWVRCLSNYNEKTLTDMLQMLYIQKRNLKKERG